MRRTIGAGLAAAATAAMLVAAAPPAAAYHYDCEFDSGTHLLVHDTVDCVYWIYLHLVP